MKILVIGAGALGGYFGGCLARAAHDVNFLVRARRAEQLARTGLSIASPDGDFVVPPKLVAAKDLNGHFDVMVVGVKSYSLDEAMDEFACAVGPNTMILPILNGLKHIDLLTSRFSAHQPAPRLPGKSATPSIVGPHPHAAKKVRISTGVHRRSSASSRSTRLKFST